MLLISLMSLLLKTQPESLAERLKADCFAFKRPATCSGNHLKCCCHTGSKWKFQRTAQSTKLTVLIYLLTAWKCLSKQHTWNARAYDSLKWELEGSGTSQNSTAKRFHKHWKFQFERLSFQKETSKRKCGILFQPMRFSILTVPKRFLSLNVSKSLWVVHLVKQVG